MADLILVNSLFTKTTFESTFRRSLSSHESSNSSQLSDPRNIQVLYPAVEVVEESATVPLATDSLSELRILDGYLYKIFQEDPTSVFTVLSINRFERKKNLELVIHSFHRFIALLSSPVKVKVVTLFLAGGYDPRLPENVTYFEELNQLVKDLNLSTSPQTEENNASGRKLVVRVHFLRSVTEMQKSMLLRMSDVVMYSPENEHFGIVPLEAMSYGKPVLVVNSGGPKETIIHEKTGYLLPKNPEAFAKKLLSLCQEPQLRQELGKAAHKNVAERFSMQRFGTSLEATCKKLLVDKQMAIRVKQAYFKRNITVLGAILAAILFVNTQMFSS